MVKVMELRETIRDSSLLENVYSINQLTAKIITTLERVEDINILDFQYLNVAVEKSKITLEKAYGLI